MYVCMFFLCYLFNCHIASYRWDYCIFVDGMQLFRLLQFLINSFNSFWLFLFFFFEKYFLFRFLLFSSLYNFRGNICYFETNVTIVTTLVKIKRYKYKGNELLGTYQKYFFKASWPLEFFSSFLIAIRILQCFKKFWKFYEFAIIDEHF